MPTFDLNLDVHKRTSMLPAQVIVRVGDTESQVLSVQLLDDGAAYTPASGTQARVDILKADGTWVRNAASLSGSKVTATLSDQAVSSPGEAKLAHVVLWKGSRQESTEGFALRVLRDVPQTSEEAAYYDGVMVQLCNKWQAYEATAERQETARVSAESTRASQERTRQANESTRQAQETSRVNAEAARAAAEADLISQGKAATTDAVNAATQARAAADAAMAATRAGSRDGPGSADALAIEVAQMGEGWVYLAGTIYGAKDLALCYDGIIEPAGSSVSGTTLTLAEMDAADALTRRLDTLEDALATTQEALKDATCDCSDCKASMDELSRQVAAATGSWVVVDGEAYGASGKASYASAALTLAGSTASGTTISLS